MPGKPQYISGYDSETTAALRRLCLYVATRLHDLMSEVRIVGGLVPSLLIDSAGVDTDNVHVGTMDLDVGLRISILQKSRYQEISRRLRNAGFANDVSAQGNPTRQRWVHDSGLTVDFLIPYSDSGTAPGGLQDLEGDFAAVVTPGLELAFQDCISIDLDGPLPSGERVSRPIWVCGPGAFLILKALAFRNRAEPKDAYDLHYNLKNWKNGLEDIVERVSRLSDHSVVSDALGLLREDFASIDSIGPASIDRFLSGVDSNNDDLRADISGIVLEFCRRVA